MAKTWNEYPTNGNEQIHYHPKNAGSVKMDEPSYDGTEERVSNNQSYELYNDTDQVNPEFDVDGAVEYPVNNQEFEQYNDTDIPNAEFHKSPEQVEEEEAVKASNVEASDNVEEDDDE